MNIRHFVSAGSIYFFGPLAQEVDPKVLVDDPPLMAEIDSLFSRTKQIVDEKVRESSLGKI